MTIASWMYVSRSLIEPERHQSVLEDIVASARTKNQSLDVTGCLISARRSFAQLIEGPAEAIAKLKGSILADNRHGSVTTIDVGQLDKRRFSAWSLAYSGSSIFVERVTEEMLTALTTTRDQQPVNGLLHLMEEFVAWVESNPLTRH